MWHFVGQFTFFFCCGRLFAQERSGHRPVTEFVLNRTAALDDVLLQILVDETLFRLERDYTVINPMLLSAEWNTAQYQIC